MLMNDYLSDFDIGEIDLSPRHVPTTRHTSVVRCTKVYNIHFSFPFALLSNKYFWDLFRFPRTFWQISDKDLTVRALSEVINITRVTFSVDSHVIFVYMSRFQSGRTSVSCGGKVRTFYSSMSL